MFTHVQLLPNNNAPTVCAIDNSAGAGKKKRPNDDDDFKQIHRTAEFTAGPAVGGIQCHKSAMRQHDSHSKTRDSHKTHSDFCRRGRSFVVVVCSGVCGSKLSGTDSVVIIITCPLLAFREEHVLIIISNIHFSLGTNVSNEFSEAGA